ncbi:deoxyribodipyrimidine photo-lyase [Streptomyces sp. SID3343]|uniref:cryptochrome/photolyase family protein n=1 Tax=Streptomyces sp. SID3343 TaxID=2690260 RepID=UPI001F16D4F7|nr:deoxyribodipyrimidine photo-lyase [Streptomyces sp. SID3343]
MRRDLRLSDHPALHAAAGTGYPGTGDGEPAHVLPVFVFDPVLWDRAGPARRAHLVGSLRALDADLRALGGGLVVRAGDPARELAALVRESGAAEVHVSADFGPYGRARDAAVEAAIEVPFRRTGAPYAVAPGRVHKADGEPYRVFTPYLRAWAEHGWRDPLPRPSGGDIEWVHAESVELPDAPTPEGARLPEVGERAALATWKRFRAGGGPGRYAELRDRADLAGTSRLSVHLKFGEIHPRTLLAGLTDDTFRAELAWREFYADVLWHRPETAREYLRAEFAGMEYDTGDEADDLFDAWRAGRTGFPFVDAGMRQLLAEGWMHNRVRMVVASFLVKDLHQEWTRGAAHFMRHLVDGDLASNSHGWQWAAGCGTDASPWFRIFNPVSQGKRFDPDGDYVRRYVPELRALAGAAVHEPWKVGVPDYPAPVVEHAEERLVALARYEAIRR